MRILALFVLFGVCAAGQTPGEPFTLLRLIRRSSGSVADSGAIQAHRAARAPVDVVGLLSITGPSQTWLVEAHGSFASIEATDRALSLVPLPVGVRTREDDLIAPATSMVALYRERLSYRPEEAIKLIPMARYFQVYVFRTGPGTDMDFAEVIRIRKLAFDTMNLDRPEMGYQVISGSMSGTYVFLAPLQSLRTIDNGMARLPVYAENFAGAARQARAQISAEAGITREQFIFRVEPGMSFVSESFAAADPDFWLKR